MIKFLNSCIRAALFWWYVVPVVYRFEMKRLYIWRDTPTWVLKEVCEVAETRSKYDWGDSEMDGFYIQALEELTLRNNFPSTGT